MCSRGRHLQGTLGMVLADDVGHVAIGRCVAGEQVGDRDWRSRRAALAEDGGCLAQGRSGVHGEVGHQGRLGGTARREDEAVTPALAHALGQSQSSDDRP